MSRLTELALDPKQLLLNYQPIVDCQDLHTPIDWLECLIRGPGGTNLFSPRVLFEYARKKRFEHTLDLLAFRCFVRELSWLCDVPFAINFHPSTLSRDREIVQHILFPLLEAGVDPSRLQIELIESAPEIDVELLVRNLNDLRQSGVRFALDDFGVGHANLRLLSIVRPEIVKIDRSLLPSDDSGMNAPCFLAAVESARSVGANIVAEGIETARQLEFVRSLGVPFAQGFYFYRPGNFQELEKRLSSKESQAAGPLNPTVECCHANTSH
jgi:EAL domain-containing protein (putative c-di-GMP-specific phosphodiesterase class I)